MNTASRLVLLSALSLACMNCGYAPGRPAAGPEVRRPEEVLSFIALYQQNCAACHGENGRNGVAMSLSNPVYLAVAGESTVRKVIAGGVAGRLMPAFAKSAGGTLTDQQIDSLAGGIFRSWSRPDAIMGSAPPPYSAQGNGDPAAGEKAFAEFCASCHGSDGGGVKEATPETTHSIRGSIVDPSYLALVSDQSLRSTVIAGRPDLGMPDWRSDISGAGSHAMTGPQVTDVVAWLASHRAAYPGQSYTP